MKTSKKNQVKNEGIDTRMKNQSGITLIALVITVIVLLILAGAAVSIGLNGDNLFSKANEAKTEWNAKTNTENTVISDYMAYIDNYGKEPLTDVYVAVCANKTLVFSNNTEDIDNYISQNGTAIDTAFEEQCTNGYPNIKNDEYYDRSHYDETLDEWVIDYNYSPWVGINDIEHVIFLNKVVPKNTARWFAGLSNLTSIENINYLNTSNVTDMSCMFYGCSNLASLNVSSFNTSNVTSMAYMFCDCCQLESLDLSNFNTSSVTDMSYMLAGDYEDYSMAFTNLNVSSFNTDQVTNMQGMFAWNGNLNSLDLSNFNTSNVTNMSNMFYCACIGSDLDLSSFNTSSVTDMSGMFLGCGCGGYLNISSFNTSNVTNMSGMFENTSIETSQDSLDLLQFDTSNVTNMCAMFFKSYVKYIDVSSFNTSNVTNMRSMFSYCDRLETIYASNNFITTNVTDSDYMFSDSDQLKSNVGDWYVDNHEGVRAIDKTYARIGTVSQKGYFSEKTN